MNVSDGELAGGRPKHMITIGQLADYAGVTIKAIRHYQRARRYSSTQCADALA